MGCPAECRRSVPIFRVLERRGRSEFPSESDNAVAPRLPQKFVSTNCSTKPKTLLTSVSEIFDQLACMEKSRILGITFSMAF